MPTNPTRPVTTGERVKKTYKAYEGFIALASFGIGGLLAYIDPMLGMIAAAFGGFLLGRIIGR